ncbi:MAG: hypothetical protein ACYS0J_19945 [Planctomycetota bacterium]|jgi:hypothetical protein
MDWRRADERLAAQGPQRLVQVPQVNGDDVLSAGVVHGRQQAVAHLAAGTGDQGRAGTGEAAVLRKR